MLKQNFWIFIVMKKLNVLLEVLNGYNLPKGDYAIFGSAPLVVVGMIDDVNDLDVIIRPSKWPFQTEGEYHTEDIEFFDNWPNEDVDDLIDNHSFEYDGVLFIQPKKVIQYKKRMSREKDMDILSMFRDDLDI
jgi:hypothetical protein